MYYEIKNKDTNETWQGMSPSYAEACKARGWKPHKCKCIWKASVDNAGNPANY